AFLSTAVASVRDAEVGDDLRLVLLVAELAEDRSRFFEQTDRPAVVAGMTQREGHIALRQCDSLSIVERAQDLQCAAMALDGVVIQAVATVLRPGGVELKRLAMRVGLRDTGREPYARRERRLHQP